MSVERFIKRLQAFSGPQVFNPWKDYDERYDIHKRSSLIRRRQLSAYLQERIGKAKMLIIAEAVGYQGGRFTGIAMTCERMLLGFHPTVSPSMVFSVVEPARTSHGNSVYITKQIQREKDGFFFHP